MERKSNPDLTELVERVARLEADVQWLKKISLAELGMLLGILGALLRILVG